MENIIKEFKNLMITEIESVIGWFCLLLPALLALGIIFIIWLIISLII